MEAIWTSAVAVAGTLLGAVITHLFQRRSARESESFLRSEALRQERIAAFSTFAGAAEDYRRGEGDRWFRRREDRHGPEYFAARVEAHRLRAVARQALYRVKLLTSDGEVIAAAEEALERARDITRAAEEAAWRVANDRAKAAIDAFVAAAAPRVR
ncbi:hypothetical protein RM780_23780 [Streptomyces sp. DSM 44917]|uniref:Uncharacterized protein n=1 Tax=Streptomyces boetiae TaxID=3075541 RepID=A0ABU2LEE9_9ACTN|nr:hypothetical protein [Streptomyces sp. DSM 44917]MDT0309950.1 hypothetical protein [Streptomyces sp. DSM 44917]